jgi:hypothetical protein
MALKILKKVEETKPPVKKVDYAGILKGKKRAS